jgi:5-methylcytosine-specific restriction protein B
VAESSIGNGAQVAWAKNDPTRADIEIPRHIQQEWSEFKSAFEKYGCEMYALFRPTNDVQATQQAVTAFLDLLLEERGFEPLVPHQKNRDTIRSAWFRDLMPSLDRSTVRQILEERRFVIIEGPPGTGKTSMATELLQQDYRGFGRTIQFHPNTTYEAFIGGLAPVLSRNELGLQFEAAPGFLMQAGATALQEPSRPYLLHIDEINRGDLSKILGEAIYLLELTEQPRSISLPYEFGEPYHRTFSLPVNLHIVGTMNSADRSIAIVDVAVRRRFAFLSLWPQMKVVEEHGCKLMQEAFQRILSIFIEHATEDVFNLVPGHSYFLERDTRRAKDRLNTSLIPLLQEYLIQGYVTAFSEPIRSYIQWLQSQ